MSKKRSGTTEEDRKKELTKLGFTQLRNGEGSHDVWVHEDLRQLMRTRKIAVEGLPASIDPQKPWWMTFCDNPAGGTWATMKKQAFACQQAVEKIVQQSAHEQQRLDITRQFRKAVGDYNQWKKDVGHWAKAGLNIAEAPAAPLTFKDLMGLKAEKNRLSTPSP